MFRISDLLGKRVLVVDHNKTSLMILERMLSSFSLEVKALRDPYEAIEMFENENFDLLIIDFNLPELSGIDLYKRLIANTENKVPKTIFVSATGRESYYNQVNQLGVKNFLVKPINQSLMFDAIMNALKGNTTSIATKDFNEEGKIKHRSILVNKNILIVEDNEINQLVAKDILEGIGIHVSIASNGYEAINHVRTNKFDAILMDVQMPIMDGYEATEILRKTYSSSELPIIAMTANALKGDREKSIEFGMNDYISKPINPEVLFETLQKWLYGKNAENMMNITLEDLNTKDVTLDTEKTLLKFGNKQDFYMDLLKIYKSSYSNLSEELSELICNKQYEDIKRYIHSLKSVTGNIGAMRLNNFITQFEKQYESFEVGVMTENLVKISNLNEELLKSISKIIFIDHPENKILSANFNVYSSLVQLLLVLRTSRAKDIKESMDYVVTNNQETGFVTQINEIKELVERYRFKEAIVMVEQLVVLAKEGNNA